MNFLKLTLISLFVIAGTQNSMASQLELSLLHPDEVLLAADLDSSNKQLVSYKQLPQNVAHTAGSIDLPFEMGDGYYGTMASAIYQISDDSGNTVGYMFVELLSYTEDPEFYLVATYVNNDGIRIQERSDLNNFDGPIRTWIEYLPQEMQSQINLADWN